MVKTKFNIPGPAGGIVSRSRLLNKIEQGICGKLTLICAQAGSGKSTLAGEWAAQSDVLVAWVTLDAFDDDFFRFWTCVTVSIEQRIPGFSQNLLMALSSVQPSDFHPFIAQFLNELADHDGKLVLVLDDYHVLHHRAIHESVAYVLRHIPDTLRLLIISRTEPPLPIGRLAAENDLTRIDAADMNFTMAEGRHFLRSMSLDLPEEDVCRLLERTEGWVAGMKLAALSLQGSGTQRLRAEMLTGHHRLLSDYLFQEVFALQPEATQSFLIRTSILRRLCAPLCEATAGVTDGEHMLEQLERSGMFLLPLDHAGKWYRYHYLFADFLQDRLRKEQSELLRELHCRAATWFEEHDDPVEAIEHYLSGREERKAVRLIHDILPKMIGEKWGTVYRWLNTLSESVLEEYPDLYLSKLFFISVKEEWAEVRREMKRAEVYRESKRTLWTDEQSRQYTACLHLVKSYCAVQHLNDLESAISHSREYFRLLPESGVLHLVDLDTGDISIVRAFGGIRGRLGKSEPFFRDMLEIWGASPSPFTGIFYIGLAEVLYEHNRMREAKEYAIKGYELGKAQNSAKVMAPAAVLLSKVYAAIYSRDQAVSFLQKTADTLRKGRNGFWADLVDAQAMRLKLDGLTADEMEDWWEKWHWMLEEDLPPSLLFHAILLVRILMKLERWKEADYWLFHLRNAARRRDRLGEQIEILLVHGMLHKQRKQSDRAVDCVAEALALAEPERYIRLFLDEGREMFDLLRDCMKTFREKQGSGTGGEYLAMLDAAMKDEFFAKEQHAASMNVHALTAKEWEVLQWLSEGLPNREIAARMNVSVGTVKTHLHRIYGKMQVNGRWEAIERYKQAWTNRLQ